MTTVNLSKAPWSSSVSSVVNGFNNQPQRAWTLALIGVVILLSLGTIKYAAAAEQTPTTHTVVIKAMKYQPDQLEVHVGDTVEWKNEDIVAHTVTARDKSLDSGKIVPGSSWKKTVTKAGTIDYGCVPHPNMKGRLVVN